MGNASAIFHRHLDDKQYAPSGLANVAKNRLFAQFHANFPEKGKNDILDDLIKRPGNIRVLFVTVAFAIGVDCPIFVKSCTLVFQVPWRSMVGEPVGMVIQVGEPVGMVIQLYLEFSSTLMI